MNSPTCPKCDCVKGCQANPSPCPILLAECIKSGQVSAAQIEAHRVLDAAIAQTEQPAAGLPPLPEARKSDENGIGWFTAGQMQAYARAAIAQTEQTAPPESALQSLARRCLWIAYCWNDHNFSEAYTYARKTAQELGINDFDEANKWLEAQPEQPTPVRQPLTHTEIVNLWATAVSSWIEVKQNPYTLFARSIEAAHGITTPKETTC